MTDGYKIKRVLIRQNGEEKQVRPSIPATSITLDKSSINFNTAGQTEQITATLTPADSTSTVSWSSSNTSIATVSSTGLVTCVTPGTCTITATTNNGLTATCGITNNWEPNANTLFYYEFEQNLNDSSGKGNNIINSTGITYVQVGGQYVVSSSGSTNGLAVNANVGKNIGTGDFAISFWLYPISPGSKTPLVFGQFYDVYPYPGPNIFVNYPTNKITFRLRSSAEHNTNISFNAWHHIVFTRISGTCYAYIDNTKVSSWSDSTSWTNAGVFWIFSRGDASGQVRGASGAKGDKYIYENVGWTADDVTNYFNQTKSIYGIS